jgi:hypothetical protein
VTPLDAALFNYEQKYGTNGISFAEDVRSSDLTGAKLQQKLETCKHFLKNNSRNCCNSKNKL